MQAIQIILEYMRYHAFWMIDFIKGSKIKKHYKDIKCSLEHFEATKEKRKTSLNNILTHAINTTSFYKENKGFSSIKDFKVINKNSIREQLNEFKSCKFKSTKTVSTSGSTGIALKVNHDKNKVLRNTADSIYFSKLAGFKIGNKLLYLRNWDKHLKKSKVLKFLQNIEELEVVELNDHYISNIIQQIKKDKSTKGWLGYPSGFERICKYLDKTNATPIQSNIKSIIAMSEGINNYTKRSMSKYFNIPTVSRYSNVENGIIAQQTPYSNNKFIINWASYNVEILKLDKDTPAKAGELGRIIITDLFNYAMPLIRYDTGDIGTIDYNTQPPSFSIVEGRKTDIIYNTTGEVISSIIITNAIDYKGVIQAQLIQEGKKEYTLKLNSNQEFNQESEMISEFKRYLGNDAIITLEYVEEVPVLSSGKRKATINNYIK